MPVKTGAAAVNEATVSAGTVVLLPVKTCAAAVDVLLLPSGVTVEVALVPKGVTVEVLFVPAGVKDTVELVPAGVPALTASLATASPVKVGWETVPAGVRVSEPPVVPTSPCAARVPIRVTPSRAVSSVQPLGQVERLIATRPA